MNKLFQVLKSDKAPVEAGDIVSDGAGVWRVFNDGRYLRLAVYDIQAELNATPLNAKLAAGELAELPYYPLPFVDSSELEFSEWDRLTDADFAEWESKTLQAG